VIAVAPERLSIREARNDGRFFANPRNGFASGVGRRPSGA
jgi:hypothetical protein